MIDTWRDEEMSSKKIRRRKKKFNIQCREYCKLMRKTWPDTRDALAKMLSARLKENSEAEE